MSATLDPLISQKLNAFARRRRRLIIIKGVLAALAALVLLLLVVAAVDFRWMLPEWLRWTLSCTAYAAVLVVLWRECLRELLHAPDERQLARLIEHAEPGLREDLLSAVELGRTPGEVFDSEQFRALLQADVAQRIGDVEMKSLLPVALIRRTIGWAAVIGAAAIAAGSGLAGWRLAEKWELLQRCDLYVASFTESLQQLLTQLRAQIALDENGTHHPAGSASARRHR